MCVYIYIYIYIHITYVQLYIYNYRSRSLYGIRMVIPCCIYVCLFRALCDFRRDPNPLAGTLRDFRRRFSLQPHHRNPTGAANDDHYVDHQKYSEGLEEAVHQFEQLLFGQLGHLFVQGRPVQRSA